MCNNVSIASAHTSKLLLLEGVILNTTVQCSQAQVTSGDQSDGSSNCFSIAC